jgi:hypothetical protein
MYVPSAVCTQILTLVVVAEGSPFAASIDPTLAQNTAARSADSVARAELLDDIGRGLLAIRAHEKNIKVLAPLFLLLADRRRLVHLSRGEQSTVGGERHGEGWLAGSWSGRGFGTAVSA